MREQAETEAPQNGKRHLTNQVGKGSTFLKLVVAVQNHQTIERAIRFVQERDGLDRAGAFVRICEQVGIEAGQLDSSAQDKFAF